MNQPPKTPWSLGRRPEYTALRLQVNVCQDSEGYVWSEHDFMEPRDGAIAQSLPQGGIPQIAHALLTEAVRREAFQVVLIQMTQDLDLLARWQAAGEEDRQEEQRILERACLSVIERTAAKMVPGAVAGVLDMLSRQTEGSSSGQ